MIQALVDIRPVIRHSPRLGDSIDETNHQKFMKHPKGNPSQPDPLLLYEKVDVTGILASNLAHVVWRAGDVFIGAYDVEKLIHKYLSIPQLVDSISKLVTLDDAVEELSTILERTVPLLPRLIRPEAEDFYFLPAIGMNRQQMAAFATMPAKEQLEVVIAVSEALLGTKPSDISKGPRGIQVDEAFWKGFIDGSSEQVKPSHGVQRVEFNESVARFFWELRLYRRFGGTEVVFDVLDVERLVANDLDYAEEVLGERLEEAINRFRFGERFTRLS